jgi:hypothetical protein
LEVTRLVRIFKYNYKNKEVMENLFLNIVQNYFIVGVVLAVVIDIAIRVIQVSRPFNLKDIAIVALAWPIVVGSLASDFINGDF